MALATPDDTSSPTWQDLLAASAQASGDVFYVIRVKPGLHVEMISESVAELFGYSAREFTADDDLMLRLIAPGDRSRLVAALAAPLGIDIDVELRWTHRGGRTVHAQHRARKRQRPDGSVVLEGSTRDITALREAEDALSAQVQELRALAEHISDVVTRTTPEGIITYVSPSVTSLLGWSASDWIGSHFAAWWHPDDVAAMAARRLRAATGDPDARSRGRVRTRAGTHRWIEVNGRAILGADGTVIGQVTVLRDIEEQVLAEAALRDSEARFRLAMAEAPQGMAIVDLERRFTEVNPALCAILGRGREWLLRHGLPSVLRPDEDMRDRESRRGLLDGDRDHLTVERRFRRGDDTVIWVQHSVGLQRDESGTPVSYVEQFLDVTRTRTAMEQLAYQASHDRLTGLLNRDEITSRLTKALVGQPRTGTRLGVLFCDVDNLKPVNDEFGHAAGDALLVAVGGAIVRSVRSSDSVARVGGDEFVVLLHGVHGIDDAQRTAAEIRAAAGRLVSHDGVALRPTLSIGVTVAAPGQDVDAVLRDADAALYAAKQGGRDRVVVFTPGLARPQADPPEPPGPVPSPAVL